MHTNCQISTIEFAKVKFLSFGRGKLAADGTWEFPCYECARAQEQRQPKQGLCWPFADSHGLKIGDKVLLDEWWAKDVKGIIIGYHESGVLIEHPQIKYPIAVNFLHIKKEEI